MTDLQTVLPRQCQDDYLCRRPIQLLNREGSITAHCAVHITPHLDAARAEGVPFTVEELTHS